MKKIVEIFLFPILAFSSLIMLFHEFRPMLWRNCVRPVVFKMRACIRRCYIFKAGCMNKINTGFKTLVYAFDKEIRTIIRLIRLESEAVANKSAKYPIDVTIRKESTVPTPYSLFYVY